MDRPHVEHLDQIERKLMALKANEKEKEGKVEREERVSKETATIGRFGPGWQAKSGLGNYAEKKGCLGRRKRKGTQARVERTGLMEYQRRVLIWRRSMAWSAFEPVELKNSFAALDEGDSDAEIPLVSVEKFPAFSTETVLEKQSVPSVGKFKKETKTQQEAARWQRITSFREGEQEVTGVQALYPLIRVEEHDDQPGLHAVSDPSRWMSTCPLTGFTKVKSVLDSGAIDTEQL